jgi:prepilin-type N-terminal cleavage/methylation domain-containing protein
MATNELADASGRAIASRPHGAGLRLPIGVYALPSGRQAGFTLVELLVVLSLISLLSAMAMVQHRNAIRRSEEAVLKTNLFRMNDAIDQCYADKGKYSQPRSMRS